MSDVLQDTNALPGFGIANRVIVAATALVALAMCLWMVLLRSVETATQFSVIDDAMYYFSIARNVALKVWVTFDGVTTTNGFHPLWELILVPFAWVFQNPAAFLKAGFVLSTIFFLGSLFLFYKVSDRLKLTGFGTLAAFIIIFANLRSFTLWFSLMESVLLLFLIFGYAAFSMAAGEKRFTHLPTIFKSGLLIGIVFLARQDSFLLFFCYLAALARNRAPGGIRSILRPATYAAFGAAIPVVPYLAVNLLTFGRLQTVSSWQKFQIPNLDTIVHPLLRFYRETLYRVLYVFDLPDSFRTAILVVVVLVVAAAVALIWKTRRNLSARLKPIGDLVAFVLVDFVFVYLFAPDEAIFSVWYHVPQIVAAGLVVGLALSLELGNLRPVFSRIGVLGGGLFLAWQFIYYPSFVAKKTMVGTKIEMAEHVPLFVPPSAPVGMFDAGIVSYFSEHPFVALNGLAGDFEVARLCGKRRYAELFGRYGIQYLVADVPESMLPALPGKILYVTSTKNKMMNMSEDPKPLVLLHVDSVQMGRFLQIRGLGD